MTTAPTTRPSVDDEALDPSVVGDVCTGCDGRGGELLHEQPPGRALGLGEVSPRCGHGDLVEWPGVLASRPDESLCPTGSHLRFDVETGVVVDSSRHQPVEVAEAGLGVGDDLRLVRLGSARRKQVAHHIVDRVLEPAGNLNRCTSAEIHDSLATTRRLLPPPMLARPPAPRRRPPGPRGQHTSPPLRNRPRRRRFPRRTSRHRPNRVDVTRSFNTPGRSLAGCLPGTGLKSTNPSSGGRDQLRPGQCRARPRSVADGLRLCIRAFCGSP